MPPLDAIRVHGDPFRRQSIELRLHHGVTLTTVMSGALPFVGAMLVMIILLMVFPDIAMWLPRQFY
ncbi:MAG: hypothetical protein V3R72_06325 [Gammaproteobacteria bacterium]